MSLVSSFKFRASSFAFLLLFSACERPTIPPPPDPRGGLQHPRLAIPERGIYQGAYMDWGDKEDTVTLEGIEQFERMVGKHQAIVASSSYWGEQTFPDENVRLIARHGSIPLIYWSPWDKPYVESKGPDRFSLTAIIAGTHDAYIDQWAERARDFDFPIIVSFANEANGSWFPWSGGFYGKGSLIAGSSPPMYDGPIGPEVFKQAYRHVVDRVRAKGAHNIQWVLHLMDYSMPQEDWNLAAEYYPGSAYCDWLGFSLYGSQFPADEDWAPFFPLFDWPYTELTLIDPTKPIMLCEWGVAELPHLGSKPDWIRDGFRLMKDPKYPQLKACVFWHERWQNSLDPDGGNAENAGKYSNLRVNSTPESLEAYRQSVADPFFLDKPLLKEADR